MKYATSLLLTCTIILAELYTWFPLSNCLWIYEPPEYLTGMSMQWQVKQVTDQLQFIFIGLSLVLYKSNYVNKAACKTFFCWYVIDLIFYFYNYKTDGYHYVYFVMALIFLAALVYEKRNYSRSIIKRISNHNSGTSHGLDKPE